MMTNAVRPQNIEDLKVIQEVPVVIANSQGLITYINDCFERVLGWSRDDLLGELITMILPSSFKDSHNLAFSRFQVSEKATVLNHPLELMTITKSQQEIMTEHYIIAEKVEDDWLFGAMLTPLN
ncbi:pas pac sensor protein [Leptolyngbya sp. Heron Island J]|uniref:PAS domain-containing protein n=1 Tax=Leptolyngbya sp. Heron Island J TaxID=1385935 RepID=UPI0003B9769E|nr:PAS domain-containing protein [Leptolyngbya sp. Heron Island J]ESA38991.1 pas pac sensor protein [Leptolyngbya sp. Heron Island J]